MECVSPLGSAWNKVIDAVLKQNKTAGLCKPVQHKDAISDDDKVRLGKHFADVLETRDTYTLQGFCFFYIL